MGKLGLVHRALGQVEQAIEYCEQALTISLKIGDRWGEGSCLGNLGSVHRALGNIPLARQHLEQALAIFEEIKSPNADQARKQLVELDD